ARARTVLAVPGTSSKRTWPLQARAARTSLISSCLPRMTDSRFSRKREATSMAASVEPLIPPEYTRGYSRGIAIRRVGKPPSQARNEKGGGYEEAVQEVRVMGGRIRRADHARRGDGRIHGRGCSEAVDSCVDGAEAGSSRGCDEGEEGRAAAAFAGAAAGQAFTSAAAHVEAEGAEACAAVAAGWDERSGARSRPAYCCLSLAAGEACVAPARTARRQRHAADVPRP